MQPCVVAVSRCAVRRARSRWPRWARRPPRGEPARAGSGSPRDERDPLRGRRLRRGGQGRGGRAARGGSVAGETAASRARRRDVSPPDYSRARRIRTVPLLDRRACRYSPRHRAGARGGTGRQPGTARAPAFGRERAGRRPGPMRPRWTTGAHVESAAVRRSSTATNEQGGGVTVAQEHLPGAVDSRSSAGTQKVQGTGGYESAAKQHLPVSVQSVRGT